MMVDKNFEEFVKGLADGASTKDVVEPAKELKKTFVCPLKAMIEKQCEEERRIEEEKRQKKVADEKMNRPSYICDGENMVHFIVD